MKKIDYIIVGLGVSGACMALKLIKEKKSFIIIDNHTNNASSVAAGIFNPVVLKRFSLVWNASLQIKRLKEVFFEFEKLLNRKYIYELPVYRVFNDEQEKKTWLKKAENNQDLTNYLSLETEGLNQFQCIEQAIGSGEVLNTGRINLKSLLDDFKTYLIDNQLLINEEFDYNLLKFQENRTSYIKYYAKKVIFCEGFTIVKNPYFDWLPIIGVKGEILKIRTDSILPKAVVKAKEFLMPLDNNEYLVGATYDRDNVNYKKTKQAKDYLLSGVKEFFNGEIEIIEQYASVRPTVIDRRPIIGPHPKINQLICFNGMGTRGTMLAPVMAEELYNYLENNQLIDAEVNISRFYNKLS